MAGPNLMTRRHLLSSLVASPVLAGLPKVAPEPQPDVGEWLQSAIDDMARQGGGTVFIYAGAWDLCGRVLELPPGVELRTLGS